MSACGSRCSDRKNSGYERVQQSLRFLEIKNSIIGPIEFDKINQNFRRGISLLMTQVITTLDHQAVVCVAKGVEYCALVERKGFYCGTCREIAVNIL